MTEENQQPLVPEQSKVIEHKKHFGRKSVLEQLPDAVRSDIDAYIKANRPIHAWKYIKEKYAVQFPQLTKLAQTTVYDYVKKHSLKTVIDPELKALILHTPPDSEVKDAIMKVTDPNISLTDKRAALLKIYQDIYDSIQKLKATQINFIDAQIEQVITNKEKVLIDIIKQMDSLTERQAAGADERFLAEALEMQQVFISAAVNSYRVTHTDQSLLASFIDNFITRIEDSMANYRATKELLKNEPVKIS